MTETTAASIVGCSDDILPEILFNLPAKTLLRLKLVSKKWRLIISHPWFAVNQFRKTHKSPTPGGLFLYHRSEQRHKIVSLPLFGNPPGSVPPLTPLLHKIKPDFAQSQRDFQSCNGLLLCIFSEPLSGIKTKNLLAICNPTTGDFNFLPNPPNLGIYHLYVGFTLVFNPFESHHYSVVAMRRSWAENQPKLWSCELYSFSSETKRWEFRRAIDGVEMLPSAHRGWFSNDTVYWIGEKLIHYYNVNSQQVGSLELSPEIIRFDSSVCKASFFSGGRFYIVERYWDGEFKFFEFDNVNMKWSNPHTQYFGTDLDPYPLAVVRGKEKKDFLFVFVGDNPANLPHLPESLRIYDLVLHKLVEMHALESLINTHCCDYVPSLIPI